MFDIHNIPFTDSDGSRMILEVDIDISERRQAELALTNLNEALAQRVNERRAALTDSQRQLQLAMEAVRDVDAKLTAADRRKDECIALLSHALRNPLAQIRYALPLLRSQRLDDLGSRAIEVVTRQANQLSRLLDDLLESDGLPAASWSCVANTPRVGRLSQRLSKPPRRRRPPMHGIEVARKLGRDLKTADVRLIALTGWGQAEDREKSRAAGWNRLDGRSVPDCP